MRIAALKRSRCQSKKCALECQRFCPPVRTGDETIIIEPDGKPFISEELCVGCGICIKKCPFGAIIIVGLPQELDEPMHRYGKNGFALYGLPVPRPGRVMGILGPNGIGKTTVVNILTGNLMPNLGRDHISPKEIFERFAGTEIRDYLEQVYNKEIKTSSKPQYIDLIPRTFAGKVDDLLQRVDERNVMDKLCRGLLLENVLERKIQDLSGGELQRVAVAASIARDANFYFFDELTPYLDIFQRINVAQIIKQFLKDRAVLVVEHDLAVLDLLADVVHVAYGVTGAYGIITNPKGARVGINEYLQGYLREENIRIRESAIKFELHAPRPDKEERILAAFGDLEKHYEGFDLHAEAETIKNGVLGIVGANGIGKTTFVKMLAGVVTPDKGNVELGVTVSYKPQYIQSAGREFTTVRDLLRSITDSYDSSYYRSEVLRPLQLENLLDRFVEDLSGGELQRVAIAECLSRDADLYVLDEPSAHLDVEQRALATSLLRRFTENKKVGALLVDHDIYMIDLASERLLVFTGEPGKLGVTQGPFEMREGMNRFLKEIGITFRRDEDTHRPRVNKVGSRLDRQQRIEGEYYYPEVV